MQYLTLEQLDCQLHPFINATQTDSSLSCADLGIQALHLCALMCALLLYVHIKNIHSTLLIHLLSPSLCMI